MPSKSWTYDNKNPKSISQRYLRNINEPRDNGFSDIPPELEAELLENSYLMRRRFRLIAWTLRDYF